MKKLVALAILCCCGALCAKTSYTARDFIQSQKPDCIWKIEGVDSGQYTLQLQVTTGLNRLFPQGGLYLNGVMIPFESAGVPRVKSKQTYQVSLQTGKVEIKNGDRIAVRNLDACLPEQLTLSTEPFKPAPFPLFEAVIPSHKNRDSRWTSEKTTFDETLDLVLKNNTGTPRKAKLHIQFRDYFQRPAGTETLTITVDREWKKRFTYKKGNSDQYRAHVALTDDVGHSYERTFCNFQDDVSNLRKRIWLKDGWQMTSVKDDGTLKTRLMSTQPPPKAKWHQIQLPKVFKTPMAWFKTEFRLPPGFRNQKYLLHFEYGSLESVITVNGKRVFHNGIQNYMMPFDVDVTPYLNLDGKNTLLVAGRNGQYAIYKNEVLKRKHLNRMESELVGANPHRNLLSFVWLDAVPKIKIGNLKIHTSFRNKRVTVETDVPIGHTIKHRILYRGRELVAPFSKTVDWNCPVPYGPTEFPLLQLESSLYDKNGNTVDVLNTRFGFREIWAEEMTVFWNGKTFRGVSRAMNRSSYQGYTPQAIYDYYHGSRKGKNYILRHIYGGKITTDILDELGLLHAHGSNLISHGQASRDLLNCNLFWDVKMKTDLATVETYFNSPSIFTWYISNEFWTHNSPESAARLTPIVKAMQKADPTRFVEIGSDVDMRGVSNIISTHYPICSTVANAQTYMPDMFYFHKPGQPFKKGDMIPNGQVKTIGNLHGDSLIPWGEKPVSINETGWVQAYSLPNGGTRFFGDRVYTSSQYINKTHLAINKLLLQGERDSGAFCWTPWRAYQVDDNDFTSPELDVVLVQKYHHFYPGTKISYDVNVFHDVLKKEKLSWYWKLVSAEGKKVARGRKTLRADFCETFREKIGFTAPAPGTYILEYGIKGRIRNTKKITVSKKGNPIVADTFIPGSEPLTKEILKRAANGATIVLLARDDYPAWLPFIPKLTNRAPAINYTFRKEHPVLKGIAETDLSYWYPAHKTGERYFDKPVSGNIRTIIEAGGPSGLNYAGLMEVPFGKGCFIYSRLNLTATENPVAQKLLANLARYRSPARRKLGVIAPANATFLPFLRTFGVSFEQAGFGSLGNYAAVMIDGKTRYTPKQIAELRNFKGTVIIHEPSEQFGLTFEEVPFRALQGRAIRTGYFSETAGLTNGDFYYRSEAIGEGRDSLYNKAFFLDHVGSRAIVSGAVPLLAPAFLAKRGNFLFDNLNWRSTNSAVKNKLEHIVTTLLDNAGVLVTAPKQLIIPDNLACTPVDLSPYLNRSMIDTVDNDGKGGWTDQGLDHSFENFDLSQGLHQLGAGTFQINVPHSCLALDSRYRKGYPEIMVPVSRKFEGLFLLHSCAWTSKQQHYSVFINYADGENYEIRMTGKVNIHDWSGKVTPFTGELDTVTETVYTRPHKRLGNCSLFSTWWPNPSPQKLVKSITFKSKRRGVPIIVALSTAVEKKTPKLSPEQAKRIFAEMSAKGVKMQKLKKYGEAAVFYEKALAAEPSHLSVYKNLGFCYEALGNFKSALQTYERSYQVDFNQPPIKEAIQLMKQKLQTLKGR
jgi:hypothetical protein